MSALKHIPGPWSAEKLKDRKIREWVIRAPGNFPCVSYELASLSGYDPIHDEGNARLIAAAPELLDALKQAVAWMEGERTPINALAYARDTIAKATGESK